MFFAQSSQIRRVCATVNQALGRLIALPTVSLRRNSKFTPINKWFFRMIMTFMITLANYFKIFDSIIGFVSIYVMDFFRRLKFSPQVLFYNISMVQNPFALYVYTGISSTIRKNHSFFQIIPVWRNIVRTMSIHSILMSLTNRTRSFNNIFTFRNRTDISSSHNGFIIPCW